MYFELITTIYIVLTPLIITKLHNNFGGIILGAQGEMKFLLDLHALWDIRYIFVCYDDDLV